MLTNLMWMVLLPYIIMSKAKLYITKVHNDGNLKSYMIETNSDTPHSFNGYDSAIEGGVESKEKASTTKDTGGPLCMEDNVVYIGQDISDTGKRVSNKQECHKYCKEVSECQVWVYYKEKKICQIKRFNDHLHKENNNAYTSGLKDCSKGLNNLSRSETQTNNDYLQLFGICFLFCPAPQIIGPAPTVPPVPTFQPAPTFPPILAFPTAPTLPPRILSAPTTVSATTTVQVGVCDDFGTPPDEGCKCNSRLETICFSPNVCLSGACRNEMN